ncbi:hypothetical protein [Yersinia pseudotuberculosis]|uniref:hypothetical protein n=1 Tax=Yersinia pseudotuberculosis TaxID=633 RepID=UPI0005E5B683|nr:hypothetical protein [Yersinia pseudotuberculosis]CNC99317.1 Uncharacterised protein [Yersinia pseudotuberculosis]
MWDKIYFVIGAIIESLHILFVIPVFTYLFFALIEWSFNPLNWSAFGQIAAVLVLIVSLFAFANLVRNVIQNLNAN